MVQNAFPVVSENVFFINNDILLSKNHSARSRRNLDVIRRCTDVFIHSETCSAVFNENILYLKIVSRFFFNCLNHSCALCRTEKLQKAIAEKIVQKIIWQPSMLFSEIRKRSGSRFHRYNLYGRLLGNLNVIWAEVCAFGKFTCFSVTFYTDRLLPCPTVPSYSSIVLVHLVHRELWQKADRRGVRLGLTFCWSIHKLSQTDGRTQEVSSAVGQHSYKTSGETTVGLWISMDEEADEGDTRKPLQIKHFAADTRNTIWHKDAL